jgi:magnesium transporter
MMNTLYLPELREMLADNNDGEMCEFCTALHPARTAEFMEGLTAEEAWRVISHADDETRAEIFSFFDHDKQVEIIEAQPREEIAKLLANLPSDDRVDMLQGTENDVVSELLPLMPVDERRDIQRLLVYPEGTAGAVMTTDYAALGQNLTVRQALEELNKQEEDLETVNYFYIVDESDHLRGLVSFRRMLSSIVRKPDTKLGELMDTDLLTVGVLDDQEDVARKVAKYDLPAIPVIDQDRRMVGIVTHDDIIDVVREEAAEDAHRIAAVEPLDVSYLRTNVWTLSWKRGIWLAILFVGSMLTAFALQQYEAPMQQVTWLVIFIPMLISSGGNCGNQSATLIITAINHGDVTLRDWQRVVTREAAMGMLLGAGLGMIGFIIALIIRQNLYEASIIPITLLLVILASTVIGSILPLMFKRAGLDPALMSNPFVAGIMDILGIVIYLNVALTLLPTSS